MFPRLLWWCLFTLGAVPLLWLCYRVVSGNAGPDPAELIMHISGEWGLRMLVLTLLVTPLRQWLGWSALLRYRRMLGLYTFFYACLHLLAFAHFYVGWTGAILVEELVERPYISVGALSLLLMLPLAVTSTRGMQRRLRRNWVRLHRLVYPAAILACLHLLWQARSDIGEALVYSAVLGFLLVWRLRRFVVANQARAAVDVPVKSAV